MTGWRGRRCAAAGAAGAACVVAFAGATGCSRGDLSPGEGSASVAVDPDALRPVRLVVHPLTRIGAGRDGKDAIILHVELHDRFDQPVKALGRVEIGLYRPVESAGAGRNEAEARQDASWTIDLTEPRANADAYDHLITRTYTLYLGTLPEWLLAWRSAAPTDNAGRLAPAIEVVFTTADSSGGAYVLRASHRLRR